MNKQKKGFLISLSGFDGVGKSTQVKLLSDYLRSKDNKVKTTEEMFGYFLLKPLIKVLRKTSGSLPGGPVKRNSKALPKLWFILAFADIWFSFIFKITLMKKKYNFVVADRFYTDIWANLLYYGYLPKWAFNIFLQFLPKPDIAFMLVVEPAVVLRREKEFPPAYYKEQARIYKNLSNQLNLYTIDASQAPQAVFADIKEKTKDLL